MTPIWLEFESGGTTVEMVVTPIHVWCGLSHDNEQAWMLYVYDLTAKVYLDVPLVAIKRFWVPKTAEEMQLSGVAKFKIPFL